MELLGYQREAIRRAHSRKRYALFLEMGLGKTVIALSTYLWHKMDGSVSKCLVVAPPRVVTHNWTDEISKWDHLKHLKCQPVFGTARERLQQLKNDADIFVIGYTMLEWLDRMSYSRDLKDYPIFRDGVDMLIIDESSNIKSVRTQRVRYLKRICKSGLRAGIHTPIDYRLILTGTPTPQTYIDLFSQYWFIDPDCWGTIRDFRHAYFRKVSTYMYVPRSNAYSNICEKIKDNAMFLSVKDHADIPSLINRYEVVDLPTKTRDFYNDIRQKLHTEYTDTMEEFTVFSQLVCSNKLAQISNGFFFRTDPERTHVRLDYTKLDALVALLEENPAHTFLLAYQFQPDRLSILRRIPYATELCKKGSNIKDWNEGKIRLLIAHPKSVGYGLNLQHGGHHIIWYGLPTSAGDYAQFNGRLYRKGQTKTVIVTHLVAQGTIDRVRYLSVKNKQNNQSLLLSHLGGRNEQGSEEACQEHKSNEGKAGDDQPTQVYRSAGGGRG